MRGQPSRPPVTHHTAWGLDRVRHARLAWGVLKVSGAHRPPSTIALPSDFADRLLRALRARKLRPPARRYIQEMVEALYAASLTTEEGRAISLQAAWVNPQIPDPDPPKVLRRNRWTWVPFARPLRMSPTELAKLAPAGDPRSSWLGVFSSADGLAVHGLLDQQTLAHDYMTREHQGAYPPPGLFRIRVEGPARLSGLIGYSKIAELRGGQLAGPPTDVFGRGLILRKLRRGISDHVRDVWKGVAGMPFDERPDYRPMLVDLWIAGLCRLLLRADAYRHGGAYIVTPDPSLSGLNLKYRLPYSRLAEALVYEAQQTFTRDTAMEQVQAALGGGPDDAELGIMALLESSVATDQLADSSDELNGAIRFVSLLTRVDGAVVLDPRLRVLGFGVEIACDTPPDRILKVVSALGVTGQSTEIPYTHFGTRHRSMMRYCWAVPGSVGFVISQDGGVRVMTREASAVLLWEAIQLEHG